MPLNLSTSSYRRAAAATTSASSWRWKWTGRSSGGRGPNKKVAKASAALAALEKLFSGPNAIGNKKKKIIPQVWGAITAAAAIAAQAARGRGRGGPWPEGRSLAPPRHLDTSHQGTGPHTGTAPPPLQHTVYPRECFCCLS
ncbi:hypothetical protein SKAU_G00358190 [Synaphobranchus kaupii]|uniref:DRBM domain-containing protein n=1 Tax=Synaphobranchus kaupii TaxID=118154 RepID=A0A9Q1EHR2_SYNKA|nr:hypothetical protein SKAU_G00358190 [Synaphobranchus kaupii]